MDAHTFDPPSFTCPICNHTQTVKPHKLFTGLLTCQHCRERLVVSWSGHYVRDPFTLKQFATRRRLRLESHPLARIRRDLWVAGQPVLLAVLGSAAFLGVLLLFQRGLTWGESFSLPEASPIVEDHPPTHTSN
ncbi:hypothetical protein ACN4EK_19365 [Pantanalinema rosaneae CENA516]|uniref:hypothetical protein n=1 Tax=Pantanalinema rosaneae TaxID=1620701 RepID=UPI003D6FC99B